MANSTKAAMDSLEGNNALSNMGDETGVVNKIEKDYSISATETDVTEMNKELGLGNTTRVTSRFMINLVKAVDYLRVRFQG